MILRREYRFEASHILPNHPGKCRRLHGHSYRFIVDYEGRVDDEQGMVIDFGDLDAIVHEHVVDVLDHHHLNDFIENPTAEWISVWIWKRLEAELTGLRQLELFEVEGASVVYRGEQP